MGRLDLILLLLAATAILEVVARRLGIPHPVLLVVGGALLALIPGLPTARLDPEVVFFIFVPPLLYWTALRTSLRDLNRNRRAIGLLSVGLVLATIAAVATLAHRIAPELTWPAAIAFGAIVSPPDPIAVTAVIRRLPIPRVIVTLLEGEGLLNDVTALVAYRMAVAAAVAGTFSLGVAALKLAWAAGAGIAVGLLIGRGILWLRKVLGGPSVVQNTISILTPFAAFAPAERIGASGVLAVVTVGLYLGRQGPRLVSPQTRLQAESIWTAISFLLEGLIFILTGLELRPALRALETHSLASLLGDAALISGAAILVRLAWVFPGAYLPRLWRRWRNVETDWPSWRRVAFLGWAGVRGGDSLVIALALPVAVSSGRPFPGRDLIVFLTYGVIAVTLVAQGLTLKPAIRLLELRAGREEEAEETEARRRTAEAGLARLEALAPRQTGIGEGVVDVLRERYRHRPHRYGARAEGERHERDEKYASELRRLRLAMIQAERKELVRLRDHDVISDSVMRDIQSDLDLEQSLLEPDPPA